MKPKKLVFASNNKNKINEIKQLLNSKFVIESLKDIGCNDDIPETANTIEENADLKSSFVYKKYQKNAFADDSGLEVFALQGAPGVHSARYAGDQKNDQDNINLLLQRLKGISNRKAQFKTIISLCEDGKFTQFEGIIEGEIINEKRGKNGFGYDPIFIPEGYQKTFADMSNEEKNKISHRGIAVKKLIDYLNKNS